MDFRSGRPRSWAARPAWEDPDPESDEEAPDPDSDPDPRVPWRDSDAESADDNSDASDEPEPTPGQQFVDHMLELYFLRKITAQDLCVACYYASLSNMEEAKIFAVRPGLQSGKYERRVKAHFGETRLGMLYKLRAHGYVKGERGRAERVYMVIPLHEALASLCLTKVTYRFLLLEHLSDKTLPECYFKTRCSSSMAMRGWSRLTRFSWTQSHIPMMIVSWGFGQCA